MYDPTTARFLTKDPIEDRGGSPNLYLYCLNNPINRHDPSGLASRGLTPCEACVVAIFFPAIFENFSHDKWSTLVNSVQITDNLNEKEVEKFLQNYLEQLGKLPNPLFGLIGLAAIGTALKSDAEAITAPPAITGTDMFMICTSKDTSKACQGTDGKPPGRACGDLKQLKLIAHELTHVVQSIYSGSDGQKFLTDYINDFLDQYQKQLAAKAEDPDLLAYEGIKYEIQAFAVEMALNEILKNAKYLKMFNDVCLTEVSKYKYAGLGEFARDPDVLTLQKEFLKEYNKILGELNKKKRL